MDLCALNNLIKLHEFNKGTEFFCLKTNLEYVTIPYPYVLLVILSI